MKKLSTKELVKRGWSLKTINQLMPVEDDIVTAHNKPIKLYYIDRVEQIENETDAYISEKKRNVINMSINTRQYEITLMDHLQDYRDGEKRIGNLNKEKVRELLRTSLNKSDILNKQNEKFVIIYPRTNDLYSGILVKKERNDFIIITMMHSKVPNKKMGLFPHESLAIELTEEETNKVLNPIQKDNDIVIKPLIRKMRKVSA